MRRRVVAYNNGITSGVFGKNFSQKQPQVYEGFYDKVVQACGGLSSLGGLSRAEAAVGA